MIPRIAKYLSRSGKKAGLYLFFPALLWQSCGVLPGNNASKKAYQQEAIDSANHIMVHTDRQHVDQAFKYLDGVYRSDSKKSVKDWFNYYSVKNHSAASILRDYDLALRYADSMYTTISKAGNEKSFQRERIEALYAKGDALFKKRNYSEAFEYYYQAKLEGEQTFGDCENGGFSYRAGMVLYRQGRYAEAASYFEKCYMQTASCESDFPFFYRRQEVLDNAGLCYSKLGQFSQAINSYKQALSFIDSGCGKYPADRQEACRTARSVIYGNIADVYIRTKEYAAADSFIGLSISLNNGPEADLRDLSYTWLKKARLNLEINNTEAAGLALEKVRSMLETVPDPASQLEYYRETAAWYRQKGALKEALDFLYKAKDLDEQQQNERLTLARQDLVEAVGEIQDKYRLEKLKEENASKKSWLIISIMGAIIALVLVAFFVYNSFKTKRYVKSLTSLSRRISDQRNKLQLLVTQLQSANKEKDRMFRVVAHDLRTPIGGIRTLADLMLLEDNLTEEQVENLELIRNACDSSMNLSNELLEASMMLNEDRWDVAREDIREVIGNTVELLRSKAANKKMKLLTELPEEPIRMVLNKEKISRAVSNIITNAIKFNRPEHDILIVLKKLPHGIQIEVADKGIGIPEEIRPKIFDMFTEAKRYGTSGEKPFGMGLSIARHIAEGHGGKIWFESITDYGTTFYIFIPFNISVNIEDMLLQNKMLHDESEDPQ